MSLSQRPAPTRPRVSWTVRAHPGGGLCPELGTCPPTGHRAVMQPGPPCEANLGRRPGPVAVLGWEGSSVEAAHLALAGCFLTAVSSPCAHLAPGHKVATQSLGLPDPVWLRRCVSLWGRRELGRNSLPYRSDHSGH